MLVIPALGRLKHKESEFETSPDYGQHLPQNKKTNKKSTLKTFDSLQV
jgi:hypothetical protein